MFAPRRLRAAVVPAAEVLEQAMVKSMRMLEVESDAATPSSASLLDELGLGEQRPQQVYTLVPSRAAQNPSTVLVGVLRRRPPVGVAGVALAAVLLGGLALAGGPDDGALELASVAGTVPPAESGSAQTDPVLTDVATASATVMVSATADPSAAVAIPPSSVWGPAGAMGRYGIPATPLAAYQRAASRLSGCGIPWWLLAGVGRIESGHAAGGRVDRSGTVRGAIYGPRLDGALGGTMVITDTDQGRLDGDPQFDRAMGPMQFLPATWSWAGRDGNGDGVANPQNVYDAALAAGGLLCRSGSLRDEAGMKRALLSYNGSGDYVATVMAAATAYRDAAGLGPSTASSSSSSAATSSTTSSTPSRSTATKTKPATSSTTSSSSSSSPSQSRSSTASTASPSAT